MAWCYLYVSLYRFLDVICVNVMVCSLVSVYTITQLYIHTLAWVSELFQTRYLYQFPLGNILGAATMQRTHNKNPLAARYPLLLGGVMPKDVIPHETVGITGD